MIANIFFIHTFHFQDDKAALKDPRFLEVWLKYASMSVKPLDVYSYMYNNGMCTQQEKSLKPDVQEYLIQT